MWARLQPVERCGAPGSPLSLIPIRLALPITALRDAAPSARSDDARASSRERQIFEDLDRLRCPQHLRAPLAQACGFDAREKE